MCEGDAPGLWMLSYHEVIEWDAEASFVNVYACRVEDLDDLLNGLKLLVELMNKEAYKKKGA